MNNFQLRINDSNEDVKKLHIMLKQLGYPVREVTEHFSTKTRNMVNAYQNDFGIEATGIVDHRTWETLQKQTGNDATTVSHEELEDNERKITVQEKTKIREEEIVHEELENRNEIMAQEELEHPVQSIILKRDSRGENVVLLQASLRALGYFFGNVDGIFGTNTEEAVKNFQHSNGLVADGIVGPLTWGKILELATTR